MEKLYLIKAKELSYVKRQLHNIKLFSDKIPETKEDAERYVKGVITMVDGIEQVLLGEE